MTAEQMARTAVRRWYVVVVGFALTLAGMYLAFGRAGVYTVQVDVVLLRPEVATQGNVLAGESNTLIAFAAIVERELNGGPISPRLSSPEAPLYGTGVRSGYRVTLPNTGGQWANNFSRPVLDVQVVGPSEAEVRSRLDSLVMDIEDVIAERETAAGVVRADRVSIQLAPEEPVITYAPGSGKRAALAIGILGGVATVFSAVALDKGLASRRRREAAVPT